MTNVNDELLVVRLRSRRIPVMLCGGRGAV